jgi:hypothetical protein
MEADGQLDDESRKMLERMNHARQSPYPTLIVEVKGLLKPDVIRQEHIPADQGNIIDTLGNDLKKLENIFAMSFVMHKRAGNINGGSIYNDDFDQVSSQLRLFEYFKMFLCFADILPFVIERPMRMKECLPCVRWTPPWSGLPKTTASTARTCQPLLHPTCSMQILHLNSSS